MHYLHVTGTVDAQGQFSAGWWLAVSSDVPSPVPDAPTHWKAAVLDDAGAFLAETTARLTERPVCPGGTEWRLDAVLPVPDEAASVALLAHGVAVLRRAVPRPATVHVDLGSRLARATTAAGIRIDGPPPGPGAYLVAAWEMPGRPPISLGLAPVVADAPPTLPLDLTTVPGAEKCRLLIRYFDGVRETAASVDGLSLEPRSAVPVIDSPRRGAEMFDTTWLSLVGRLDGDGDPDALKWFADGQFLGSGTNAGVNGLAPGPHTIALRYGTVETTAQIVIHPAPIDEVSTVPWEPPWRSSRSVRAALRER